MPSYATIKIIAITTGTDNVIIGLTSLDATSTAGGWTGFATTGHACTAYTARVAAASITATQGIAFSPVISAMRAVSATTSLPTQPAPPLAPAPSEGTTIAAIPIAAISIAAIPIAAISITTAAGRKLHQEGWDLCLHCRKHNHHKMYFHCLFCNFK
jgi:hypothetical protein